MTEAALFQAILADPEDDAPRLVYADWLDEHGQPERAEFIRTQCEAERLPRRDPRRRALQARAWAVAQPHRNAWLAELPQFEGCSWATPSRGFVEGVTVSDWNTFAAQAQRLFAVAPLRRLVVSAKSPREAEQMARSSLLGRLTELRASVEESGLAGVPSLVRSPYLANLTSLDLQVYPSALWLSSDARLSRFVRGVLALVGIALGAVGPACARGIAESARLNRLALETVQRSRGRRGGPGPGCLRQPGSPQPP